MVMCFLPPRCWRCRLNGTGAVGISGQKHGYMQDLARHYLEDPASFDDVAGGIK